MLNALISFNALLWQEVLLPDKKAVANFPGTRYR